MPRIVRQPFQALCGRRSGQRPNLVGYVPVTGARGGATAAEGG